ncbi:MAG: PQQ-binding-like beta-propeller repeat protein, partial [Planctomycetales bacterium]|nr:PQQ-binding-like beta-propeller repeat protein [Planctomycetales bacterium]
MRAFTLLLAGCLASGAYQARAEHIDPAKAYGVPGGLVVQLGASEVDAAAELSLTGRYLIHVLERDPKTVESAQASVRRDGRYGLAWVERQRDEKHLPYAENMVNLLVVREFTVPVEELFRVLAPRGVLVVDKSAIIAKSELEAAGFQITSPADGPLIAYKPWPKEMDVWSHPRHAADGNAVSSDTLVGPPQRVRWLAAATSEVEGLVTSGGRNFYGGILARDSFNGLRLWHRDLRQADGADSPAFNLPRLSRDGPRPVAAEKLLFAVVQGRCVALDPATGAVIVEFRDIVNPTSVTYDGARVIAADAASVRAFDGESGKMLWKLEA